MPPIGSFRLQIDMQTSGKEARFWFPECSLPYAKAMQTSGKEARFWFPECSLPYAKAMQTSGKEARFWFPECSLPYAKITINMQLTKGQSVKL